MTTITKEQYLELKKNFSDVGSWTLWSAPNENKPKSNISDLSFFEKDDAYKKLNTNYVFVGLNCSKHEGRQNFVAWHNFHSVDNKRQQDYKLRYALNNSEYVGSYMTDLFKNYPEVSSVKVNAYLKNNLQYVEDCIKVFQNELDILGSPIIVAMGKMVYRYLIKKFPKYRIVLIPHYSAWQYNCETYKQLVTDALAASIDK